MADQILAIDGKPILAGHVPDFEKIKKLLQEAKK